MIYLLDTNACIALWQRQNLVMRANVLSHRPADIVLCSVVKAELLFGAQRSARSADNLLLLEKLFAPLVSFDFDDAAALHYAQIREHLSAQGNLIGANDLIIAAIARANGATLITHNIGEFSRVPNLSVEDWQI